MSDIVERLRELEAVESELAGECDCPPEATANYRYAMTCAEAADLITALRAENERLLEDLIEAEKYNGYHQQACLEIERLRAALWDIHAVCNNWDWFIWMWPIRRIKRIARAALEEKQ